ncbi:sister chromatid cohesion protein PDS5 homolog C-like [Bidens hawaiensis]|uniref:sister chromatid cohesion protein PDS5 homolog C-like n=1 Tax=Bidens hawaiensis TaxID=980011 RepID=UPI00404AB3CE
MEVMEAGMKLLHPMSSLSWDQDILSKLKDVLRKVEQKPSESMKNALRPVIKALVAQELVTHPNLDVNISLSCCFCEILRICAPDSPYDDQKLKAFFEMVVLTLEKLPSASGRSYTEMGRVLEIFNRNRLSLLMLDLQLDGARLKLRLFKQFLAVYGYGI